MTLLIQSFEHTNRTNPNTIFFFSFSGLLTSEMPAEVILEKFLKLALSLPRGQEFLLALGATSPISQAAGSGRWSPRHAHQQSPNLGGDVWPEPYPGKPERWDTAVTQSPGSEPAVTSAQASGGMGRVFLCGGTKSAVG